MNLLPTAGSFEEPLLRHLQFLYPSANVPRLAEDIVRLFDGFARGAERELWSERDSLLITYGNSIAREDEAPLRTLGAFLDGNVGETISSVHVLPFCPYSSDDGFAVIDYDTVNPELGTWDDLSAIAERYRLMADLVINHVSSESAWFQNYRRGRSPGAGYFIDADPEADYSEVVRPRSSPLLRPVDTDDGTRYVWCTFSHDQIDLNFRNPEVLIEVLRIVRHYLDHGVRIFRLDAIGYLWKTLGTPCIHLPETHEIVRLIRTVLDAFAPGTILITETNVPNQENLSYFGNCNEAHIIYNFSLAPLVTHALLVGHSAYLRAWMMSMPPSPIGCTYLNFTASHDGIGMRPAEGLLSDDEQAQMIETIEAFGGLISRRRMADGSEKIYELNISLFDALQGTVRGRDRYQIERFLCSQTIMMGLEGLPAFYIHSLLATPNDVEGVRRTGRYRSINRRQWEWTDLESRLDRPDTPQSLVSRELLRRIEIRSRQAAFHPNATQFTLQLRPHFFGFWRQSRDRQQSIFAVHNLSPRKQKLALREINLIYNEPWIDLLSGRPIEAIHGTLTVEPYQCLWITNRS